jgi:hypothetical protein
VNQRFNPANSCSSIPDAGDPGNVRISRMGLHFPRFTTVERVHVGCGSAAWKSWLNVDMKPVPGADRRLSPDGELPFRGVRLLVADHVLEHLAFDQALAFLREARRALVPSGVIRVITPNLEWVYRTHYRVDYGPRDEGAILDCLRLNQAFHGWGHLFLYNAPTLSASLRKAGFSAAELRAFGESPVPELRNIDPPGDRPESADLSRVLAVEASKTATEDALPDRLLAEYRAVIDCR